MSTTNVTMSTQDSSIPGKPAFINVSPLSGSLRQPSPAPAPKRPLNPRHKSSIRVEDSLTQPRDTEKHSKWPFFMRMHGSITPRMIVPLVFIGIWATIITCISKFVYPLVVSDLLLTVLGFVVGLGISFRTSSAYERYVDGRKYWGQLSQSSRDLARHLWIHVEERHDKDEQLGKADLLGKVTALNLVVAFAVALKHRLRYEPFAQYEDLEQLVSHLSTFANDAYDPNAAIPKRKSFWKESGEYLGLTFAESNPRKLLKRSPNKNFGNLPLEILTYLSAYTESVVRSGQLPNSVQFAMAMVRPFFHSRALPNSLFINPYAGQPCLSERGSRLHRARSQHPSPCCLLHCYLPNHLGLRHPPPLSALVCPRLDHDSRHHRWRLHYPRHRCHWP